MGLFQVINVAKEFLILGVMCLILIGLIYLIFFRRILKNHVEFDIKKVVIFCVLFCYVVIVIGGTIFIRSDSHGYVNLHLFSSYIEAWNNYSKAYWRNIVLNILMFVPFGFLLPMFNDRFKKFHWTMSLAFLFTLGIEVTQYMTKRGIFEVDDLLNNWIGALIGYSLITLILTILDREKSKWKFAKIALCLLPLTLLIAAGFKITNDYNRQEFGNLSFNYNYIRDMSDVDLHSDLKLSDREHSISTIKNSISKYSTYGKYDIISQKEAYDRLKAGKFNAYELYDIDSITVRSVKLCYKVDSKGFYQPVYQFECTIDGLGRPIFIPALKNY